MLILDFNFKGIAVQSALIEVGALTISENHSSMTFAVNFKANNDSAAFQTDFYSCEYIPSGTDPVTQAYAYLKTLDTFSGSTELA